MSVFYCTAHQRVEDSDYVGYYVLDGNEVCDEGAGEYPPLYEIVLLEDRTEVIDTRTGNVVNTWEPKNTDHAIEFAERLNELIYEGRG